MDFLIEFYQGLDTLNLIIFWGVIIVVLLLLIFSITIANKNKKLKMVIDSNQRKELANKQNPNGPKEESIDSIKDDIPIIMPEHNNIHEESKEKLIEEVKPQQPEEPSIPLEEEKKFVAEEHVIGYNKDNFSLSNIKKTSEYQENKTNYESSLKESVNKMPTGPYQRNVLREMSLGQTSPIGIVKPIKKEDKELDKAKELSSSLNETTEELQQENPKTIFEEPIKQPKIHEIKEKSKELPHHEKTTANTYYETTKEEVKKIPQEPIKSHDNNYKTFEEKTEKITIEQPKQEIIPPKKIQPVSTSNIEEISKPKETNHKEDYLKEVSKKLAESQGLDSVDRTEYELLQEEEAIISYEELMRKKDTIKIVDEEEAVISIDELMKKKKQEEKLYNLTEDEENDKFISELKSFRNDL